MTQPIEKPDSGYPFIQHWPPRMSEHRPEERRVEIAVPALNPGATFDFARFLDSHVIYGVFVGFAGLSGAQQLRLELHGDQTSGASQYVGNANSGNGWADAFQQWRYRDREGYRELRGTVTNTGGTATPACTLTIVGEHF